MKDEMKLPEHIRTILDTLQAAGHEAYVVGGCVRDWTLHQEPKDYDICTSSRPEQVEGLFEKTVPTGLKHGTVTVIEQGMPAEVTTFRTESGYADHRHPDSVRFTDSLEEDLARRDFTMNAMAWNPQTGLRDPFGGREDLNRRILRCVGNPETRFEEDALRMLRALRFAARYNLEPDPGLLEALQKKAPLMEHVAVERIRPELEEIMLENPDYLEQAAPLLKPWIPELEESLHTAQHSKWHYTDVLHHTIDAMKHAAPLSREAAWALLLHDLGKPAAKTTSEDGMDHFKKHALFSAKIARRVLKTFGFSRKDAEKITQMVLHHDDHLKPVLKTIYKYRIENGWDEKMMDDFLQVQRGDILAHSSLGKDRMEEWQAFRDFYDQNAQGRPYSVRDLDLDGTDLEKELGLKGKAVGQGLKKALEYAFYHPEKNTRKDLLEFLKGQTK